MEGGLFVQPSPAVKWFGANSNGVPLSDLKLCRALSSSVMWGWARAPRLRTKPRELRRRSRGQGMPSCTKTLNGFPRRRLNGEFFRTLKLHHGCGASMRSHSFSIVSTNVGGGSMHWNFCWSGNSNHEFVKKPLLCFCDSPAVPQNGAVMPGKHWNDSFPGGPNQIRRSKYSFSHRCLRTMSARQLNATA